MNEVHDVMKSSNPDVQALLRIILGLVTKVEFLTAEVAACRFELDALPEQYVIPGPNGEHPPGTVIIAPLVDAKPADVAAYENPAPLAAPTVLREDGLVESFDIAMVDPVQAAAVEEFGGDDKDLTLAAAEARIIAGGLGQGPTSFEALPK